ncbi:MAG TPA: O-antigen polysaccharide polymerase Wzy [Cryptosporangiaceae bacterium]|nr:O-antigen polysaccharide polymerase Wzy [Cryptosporangiaceae bacterium]
MNGSWELWLPLLVGVGVLVVFAVSRGGRDLLLYIGAFFFVFAFGPVLNHLLGGTIYLGTVMTELSGAATGFSLAMVGMLVAGLVVRQRPAFDRTALTRSERAYPLVPVILLAAAAYAVSVLLLRGPDLLAGSKLARISAAGSGHYGYLLIELFACSLYFLAVRTRTGRICYWVNLGCYTAYCLATAERDFILVFFALLLHTQLFHRRSALLRNVALAGALLYTATYLFAQRSGGNSDAEGVLNQGSLLFVDTFVRYLVPDAIAHTQGSTYLSAMTSLLPTGGTPRQTLMQWLVDTYSPGNPSGYGFSLTAEAYLNFGQIGIPVAFALFAVVHRLLVNRVDRGHVYAYASLLYTVAWTYSMRGESATFLRTLLYGALFYAAVHLTSIRKERQAADEDRGDRRTPVPADAGRSRLDPGRV